MTAAPADARPHAPWPLWRKVAAYVVLGAVAGAMIWYVDREAHKPPAVREGGAATQPRSGERP